MESMDKSGLLDAILTSAEDYAIIVISLDRKIATWNAGAQQVFGYSGDEAIGQELDILFTEEDRSHDIPDKELELARTKGRAFDYRWHLRKDGSCFWADGVMSPMYGADGGLAGYVKILRDATERHAQEIEIQRLARVDALTGLANRAEFDARFRDMTAAAERHRQLLILQVIDLDHFKQVNDRFGHQTGDGLLAQVAQRLSEHVRETDLVARLGGDEFVVLQPDAGTPEVGATLADKLIEALSQPFLVDGHSLRIGTSIGISVYPHDASDPDQLLRKADLALYKVKAESRNGYHYFSEELDLQAYRHSRDLVAVRRAVAETNFSVYYQPKVKTSTGKFAAVEALLRCNDPVLAGYPIERVIDLAIEAGVMEKIGPWVAGEATARVREWQEDGLRDLKLCVNLSPSEMADPQLPGNLSTALARSGLAAECLIVELTEHEIFDSGERGVAILNDIRERGIAVTIDDFGTGYSSLSYLSELTVDAIKLDRSFLRNIPESEQHWGIAAAIVGLAHSLNLEVVAEGVETIGQVEFCRREHCDWMQGFFFCEPMPAAQMRAWLLERADVDLLNVLGHGQAQQRTQPSA